MTWVTNQSSNEVEAANAQYDHLRLFLLRFKGASYFFSIWTDQFSIINSYSEVEINTDPYGVLFYFAHVPQGTGVNKRFLHENLQPN